MAFLRTRTIKGRKYRYREERWREGGKVRSKSVYLGPEENADGFVAANFKIRRYGMPDEEKALAAYNERTARDEADRQAHLDKLHDDFGLKMGPSNPTPVDKETPAEAGAKEGPEAPAEPTPSSS